MSDVVILGAGLAGLSCAYHLGGGFRVVEKRSRPGGLCTTEVIEGFSFDRTGHWLHLRDPGVRALVDRLMPGAFVTVQRAARIYSYGAFTRYPYQVNTHGLPPEVIAECVLGFVEAHWGPAGEELRRREPRDFSEFVLRHLGQGFAQHFMFPYNQKLWTVHPRELSAAWCGRFVPRPTLEEVVAGALGIGSDASGYNATFLYPRAGGVESLPRSFLPHLRGPIDFDVAPASVDWRSRTVALSDGRTLRWRSLVSTIDLPNLVALIEKAGGVPDEVSRAARLLKATTVTYVNVAARGAGLGHHWVYFPGPEFPFYRAGSASSAYPRLAPEGCVSFYVEFSHRGTMDRARAEQDAVRGLVRSGMIRSPDDVLFAVSREIPDAYVLFDAEYGPARERILAFLADAGIETAGRYGRWEYSSMEDAIIAGREVAERVRSKPG